MRSEDSHVQQTSRNDGDEATAIPRPRLRWLKRLGIGFLVTVLVVIVLGVMAYEFGTMEPPTVQQRAAYAALVRQGKMPPVQFEQGPRIPIPGCKCHSNDAYLAVQHSSVPIRQCSSCHGG